MDWALKTYKWTGTGTFPVPPDLAMGAFGCNAGLAPYQGEGTGSKDSGKDSSKSSGTSAAPVCKFRDGVASAHHLPIYPSAGDPDIDWYIQGQAPLNS